MEKYKILYTEAKYSVDGKDHYSILVDNGNKGWFGEPIWERAINKSFSTYCLAEKALKKLKNKGGKVNAK